MCTGLELALIGGLGIGGGTYLQNRSMEKKQDAADKHALAGLMRQDQYDKDRASIYQEALGAAGDEISQEALDAKATKLTEDLRSNVDMADIDYGASDSGTTPRVLQNRAESRRGEGQEYLDLLSDAQGRLGAWGDQMWQFGDQMGDFAWQNDRLLTDAGMDANIAQAQAEHAYNTTGNKTAMAGNVANQLGAMLMTQGLFNAGAASLAPKAPGVIGPGGQVAPGVGVPIQTPSYNPYQALV